MVTVAIVDPRRAATPIELPELGKKKVRGRRDGKQHVDKSTYTTTPAERLMCPSRAKEVVGY